MYNTIKNILIKNDIKNCIYVEPFAGGAEVALRLLYEKVVDEIIINDYDIAIYSFWYSILNHTEEFIKKIENCEINYSERKNQIYIYNNPKSSTLELGFATFYLNRVNRSGIIKGGPISKDGSNYPLDCRFNKVDLINRIRVISKMKDRIFLFNKDAKLLLKDISDLVDVKRCFMFIDPPYYYKAKSLYMNYYSHNDHVELKEEISQLSKSIKYVVTYDNVKEINEIYTNYKSITYELSYTVEVKRKGKEIMFLSDNLSFNLN